MNEETYNMPLAAAPTNHGRTRAAWTLFALVVVGVLIAGAGAITLRMPVIVAGLVVVGAGMLASFALRVLGKGQPRQVQPARDWYGDQPA